MGSHELFFNRNIVLKSFGQNIIYIYIYIYITFYERMSEKLSIHPQTLDLFLFVDNSIWYCHV